MYTILQVNDWIRNDVLRAIASELALLPVGAWRTVPLRLIEQAQPRQAPDPGTYAAAVWAFAFSMAHKAVPEDPLLQEVLADFSASQRIEVLRHFDCRESPMLLFRNLAGAERGPSIKTPPEDVLFHVMRLSLEVRRRQAEIWIEPELFSRLLVDSEFASYLWRGPDDVCDGRFFNGVRIRDLADPGDGIYWLQPKPDAPAGLF
jgi:hypothetical protein